MSASDQETDGDEPRYRDLHPSDDHDELIVYDREDPDGWVQSDWFASLEDIRSWRLGEEDPFDD